MTVSSDLLCKGSPSFADPQIAAVSRGNGAEAAWRAAFSEGFDCAAAVLARVSGSFALGLSDSDGRAILAVDRFAVCSLCYRIADGRLLFSDRADELADAGSELEPQAIFDYLYFHAIPSPRTVFQGVCRLPPGHFATFENGRVTVAPYWKKEFSEPRGVSFGGLQREFRALLQQAVANSLDGSKAACFLSGGTDSSTVAGMIGMSAGHPASTYSIGFDAEGYDEMAFARIAAKRFGTDHHEYYLTPEDLVHSIGAVAGHFDQPFGNSSALPAYYCAKFARNDGVTRLLAGDGGDELFGGNSRYSKQRIFGWYDVLPAGLRQKVLEPALVGDRFSKVTVLRKAGSYIEQARVPLPDRLQMYNLLLRLGVRDVLCPGFLALIRTEAPEELQRSVWQEAATARSINQTLAFDWRFTLAESDLPKVRETTQLAGIEVAFPLLDDALVDFSLRLPAEYKLKGLKLRWFFKEALRGFLPDEILSKKKQGFGLPFGVWLTRHDALRRLAADSLASLSGRGIVRPDFMRQLLDQRLVEHPGYYGEMVWILMMLEQWLQRHAPGLRISA